MTSDKGLFRQDVQLKQAKIRRGEVLLNKEKRRAKEFCSTSSEEEEGDKQGDLEVSIATPWSPEEFQRMAEQARHPIEEAPMVK